MRDAERFGPFRIVAPIGRGGMSTTHVAEREAPDGNVRRVCLKRLRSTEADDPKWIRAFEIEARIAERLRHPNIVALEDWGQTNGTWWMSYELVDGTDLAAILDRRRTSGERFSTHDVVHVAREVAKALAYVHSRCDARGDPLGLVHRDVSPGNVMIGAKGEVMLTDFGIAKVTHSERTKSGEMKGKAPYMAPEHSLGRDLDGRSDLFSLGVVMFEMLTGERPFDGRTPLATQVNAVMGERKAVRELAPAGPAWLASVIDRLLQPDPALRYATAGALFEELRTHG